jgi:hypothetical protein
MTRLLLLYCPANPRTLHQAVREDLDVVGPEDRFRWCLIEHATEDTSPRIVQEATGSLNDIPFADEALVLMPTVDVRLVHTKVPLISGRKLDALLPTLAEPYLLDQRTPLRHQLLPPTAGRQGVDRTIVITSESWMHWLHDRLALLPVRTLTLIPDCLLLTEPGDDQLSREFLIDRHGPSQVIATRDGFDWGVGWAEHHDGHDTTTLTDLYPQARILTLNWSWLVPRALSWLQEKPPINLVSRQPASPSARNAKTKPAVRWRAKIEWANWRPPLRLAGWLGATYVIGSLAYLGVLAISNWRWQNTLADTARPHLATPVPDNTLAITTFVRQASAKIHAQGQNTPADFSPMAGKLQNLLSSYPPGILESVRYQPNGLAFTLRTIKGTPAAATIAQRASDLEIALLETGKNEYRMLPLAGLPGSDSP